MSRNVIQCFEKENGRGGKNSEQGALTLGEYSHAVCNGKAVVVANQVEAEELGMREREGEKESYPGFLGMW